MSKCDMNQLPYDYQSMISIYEILYKYEMFTIQLMQVYVTKLLKTVNINKLK